jgi:hypothetical protein
MDFRDNNNSQHALLRRGSKAVGSMSLILYRMLEITSKCEQRYFVRPNSQFPLRVYSTLLLSDFAGSNVGELWWTNQEFFLSILFHRGSPCTYITWGMNNRQDSGHS